MSITCPHCDGTGYEALESANGGMVDTECTCALGRATVAPFIGPPEPSGAWLADREFDKHRAAMQAEGRWECWICHHTWHEDGEACPVASKPSGWIHPDYRQIGETT